MTVDSVDSTNADDELRPDVIFELLSNARRRSALRVLDASGVPLDVDTLAAAVAARTADPSSCGAETDPRERVVVSLHHSHLPRLDDAGLVVYEGAVGRVRATDGVESVRHLLDPSRETGPDRDSGRRTD